MSANDEQHPLITHMANLQEKAVMELVAKQLSEGVDALTIIDLCHKGMIEAGERYEQKRYFISGLIMAGEIMRLVSLQVLPLLDHRAVGDGAGGRIVLGTVEGDIHDIGKDIFKVLARVYGFAVHDLGVDVPASKFLSAIHEYRPHVVGLSCLITAAYQTMQETISLLRANTPRQLAPRAYVIGGRVDDLVCADVKADYWTNDGMRGIRICQQVMGHGEEGHEPRLKFSER
jgi:methanogenic corrinoid protein MtbC1